jgi:ABC-type sulfate transport system permease subunit
VGAFAAATLLAGLAINTLVAKTVLEQFMRAGATQKPA